VDLVLVFFTFLFIAGKIDLSNAKFLSSFEQKVYGEDTAISFFDSMYVFGECFVYKNNDSCTRRRIVITGIEFFIFILIFE